MLEINDDLAIISWIDGNGTAQTVSTFGELVNVGEVPPRQASDLMKAAADTQPLNAVTLKKDGSASGEASLAKLCLNVSTPNCDDLPLVEGECNFSERVVRILQHILGLSGALLARPCKKGDRVHAFVPQLKSVSEKKVANCWVHAAGYVLQIPGAELCGPNKDEIKHCVKAYGIRTVYLMSGSLLKIDGCEVVSEAAWLPCKLSAAELQEQADKIDKKRLFWSVCYWCNMMGLPIMLVAGKQPNAVNIPVVVFDPTCHNLAYLLCAVFARGGSFFDKRLVLQYPTLFSSDALKMIGSALAGSVIGKELHPAVDVFVKVATEGHRLVWAEQYTAPPQDFPAFTAEPSPEFDTMIRKAMAAANERKRFLETTEKSGQLNSEFQKKTRTTATMFEHYGEAF